jgi:HPr kinase/phosphorylase
MLETPHYYHATAVAYQECGFLLRGITGAGKSDLALRLFKCGGALIADDQTILSFMDGHIIATCPEVLKNQLEIRGIGLVSVKTLESHPIHVIINLRPSSEIERMPKAHFEELHGVALPVYEIDARCPSAVDKLEIIADLLKHKRHLEGQAA